MTPSIDRREKTVSVGDFVVDVDGAVIDVDGGRHQTTRPSSSNHTSALLRSMGRAIDRASSGATIDDACHQTWTPVP
jgi:very-short-patch-repair endonuclease